MDSEGGASEVMDREEWMRRTGPLYPALVAVRLLTRVPVLSGAVPNEHDMARAAPWFPVVGGLIGGLLAALAALVLETDLVPAIVAALVLALAVLVTGALHESGLATTADALGRAAAYETRSTYEKYGGKIGFYGLLALVSLIAVRGILLLGTRPAEWTGALIASQVAMRWTLLLLLKIGDRIGDQPPGDRTLAVGPFSWSAFTVASGLAVLVAMFSGSGIGLLSLVVAALVAFLVGLYFQKRDGGLSSETLAAASVACEVAVLVVFAAAYPAHVSPWAS